MKKSIINISLFILTFIVGFGENVWGQMAHQGVLFVDSKCNDQNCLTSKVEIQNYLNAFKECTDPIIVNVIYSSQDCDLTYGNKVFGPEVNGNNLWKDQNVDVLIYLQSQNSLYIKYNTDLLDGSAMANEVEKVEKSYPNFNTASCEIIKALEYINDNNAHGCHISINMPNSCLESTFKMKLINLNGVEEVNVNPTVGMELSKNFDMPSAILGEYSILTSSIHQNGVLRGEYSAIYGNFVDKDGVVIINRPHSIAIDDDFKSGIHIYREKNNSTFKNFYDLGPSNIASISSIIIKGASNPVHASNDALIKIRDILLADVDDIPDDNNCDEFDTSIPPAIAEYEAGYIDIPNDGNFNIGSMNVSKSGSKELSPGVGYSDYAGLSPDDLSQIESSLVRFNQEMYENLKVHYVITSSDNITSNAETNTFPEAKSEFETRSESKQSDINVFVFINKEKNTFDITLKFNCDNYDQAAYNSVTQHLRDQTFGEVLNKPRAALTAIEDEDNYTYGLTIGASLANKIGALGSITKSVFTTGALSQDMWTQSDYEEYTYNPEFAMRLHPSVSGPGDAMIGEVAGSYMLLKTGYSVLTDSEVRSQIVNNFSWKDAIPITYNFDPNAPGWLLQHDNTQGATELVFMFAFGGVNIDGLNAVAEKSGIKEAAKKLGGPMEGFKKMKKKFAGKYAILKNTLKTWPSDFKKKFLKHFGLLDKITRRRFSKILTFHPELAELIKDRFDIDEVNGYVLRNGGDKIDVPKILAAFPEPPNGFLGLSNKPGFVAKLKALKGDEFDKLFKDISKVPDDKLTKWAEEFAKHPNNLDTWKALKKKFGPNAKKVIDAHLITKLSEVMSNESNKIFEMLGIERNLDDLIDEVVKKNEFSPCRICKETVVSEGLTNIDEYLTHIDFIANNLDLNDEGIGLLVGQIKSNASNITKGASFTMEVVYNECKSGKWDPSSIYLEYTYVTDHNFAADIATKDAKGNLVTLIDNKNWGENFLKNTGFTQLNQAKEMIKSGMGKYFFRARKNVNLQLIKEKFAEFLKKGSKEYGNLKEIAKEAEDNFITVFGKEAKLIEAELRAGNLSSLDNLISIKDYK